MAEESRKPGAPQEGAPVTEKDLLLAMVQGGGAVAVPRFRGAQKKVLLGLATQRDKDIAAAVGLSTHGVRYHIRNIFWKLEVGDRAAAVQRARALGLPPAP